MSYLKKSDAKASIKCRVQKLHGNNYTIFEAYLGTDPYSKKPVRKSAKRRDKLEKIIDDFYKKLDSGGDAAVLLTAYQSMDARNALDLLSANNLTLSLTECVRRVVEGSVEKKEEPCTKTIRSAYDEYFAAQKSKSPGHQNAVASRVGRWVTAFGGDRLLSEVTVPELAAYLTQNFYDEKRDFDKPEKRTTYNNHLGYIKTFMTWCTDIEHPYLKESPIEKMKTKQKNTKDVEYLHSADCAILARHVVENKDNRPEDLADFILSFFCGMRQSEIARVREGSEAVLINLKEKYVRVIKCKGHLRGIRPRTFTIPDIAYRFITEIEGFDFMSAVMRPNRHFRRHLVEYASFLKIDDLPENVGRHTFCTMHTALYHDPNALSAIVGNTEDVRDKHYDGRAPESEGREFFSITPNAKLKPSEN